MINRFRNPRRWIALLGVVGSDSVGRQRNPSQSPAKPARSQEKESGQQSWDASQVGQERTALAAYEHRALPHGTSRVLKLLSDFKPDVLHITGPSDVGIMGTLVAHRMKIPLVGSWHTNVHQYAERRALPLLGFLPSAWRSYLGKTIRELSFRATARFYHIPRILMAPNQDLVALLERAAGKPCFLMGRGVDTELFHPAKRSRTKDIFTLGYVGRITPEKNVGALVEIEHALHSAGVFDCRFLVVGQGSSASYLQSNLKNCDLTGVLKGEDLARAYTNMMFSFSPQRPTHSATSCWKRFPPEFRRWLPKKVDRSSLSKMPRPDISAAVPQSSQSGSSH